MGLESDHSSPSFHLSVLVKIMCSFTFVIPIHQGIVLSILKILSFICLFLDMYSMHHWTMPVAVLHIFCCVHWRFVFVLVCDYEKHV